MEDPDSPSIRLAIADDDLFVRDHLSDYVAASPDIELVATCATGHEVILLLQQRTIDVVLMDIQMPVMDGPAATRQITASYPSVRVIALTSFGDDASATEMLAAGAAGFLLKSTRPAVLFEAIKTVHHGLAVLPTETVHHWSSLQSRSQGPVLDERERQILDLIAQGLSNSQIGRALFVSTSTVKQQLHDLMAKFRVTSRTALVARAHESRAFNRL